MSVLHAMGAWQIYMSNNILSTPPSVKRIVVYSTWNPHVNNKHEFGIRRPSNLPYAMITQGRVATTIPIWPLLNLRGQANKVAFKDETLWKESYWNLSSLLTVNDIRFIMKQNNNFEAYFIHKLLIKLIIVLPHANYN